MQDAGLSERLMVHYVGGRWRAPLGTEPLPVGKARVACAAAPDVARAVQTLSATEPVAFAEVWRHAAGPLSLLRRAEGFDDTPPEELPTAPAGLPRGPFALLSAGAAPLAGIASILARGARLGGVVWKPAPRAAASAHAAIEALKETLGQGVAMLHGGHDTGRALVAAGLPVVWLSAEPVPESMSEMGWTALNPFARD